MGSPKSRRSLGGKAPFLFFLLRRGLLFGLGTRVFPQVRIFVVGSLLSTGFPATGFSVRQAVGSWPKGRPPPMHLSGTRGPGRFVNVPAKAGSAAGSVMV